MGVLGVSGKGNDDHTDPPDVEPETPAAQPRDDAGQFVPAEKLQPETPTSRRDRLWQERVANYVKPIEEKWNTERQTYQQQLEEERRQRQELATEMARTRGMLEAMQRQPMQQAQQQTATGPDPDKLYAEADDLLQKNDIRGYHAKLREANRAEAQKLADDRVKAAREEWQRSQQPQLPPHVQALMMQHPNVLAAGDKGMRKVIRIDQDLEDEGMPPGYARQVEAFKRANEALAAKKPPAAPSYSTESRAALAAVPTGRSSGSAAAASEGVRLTPAQEVAMKAGGFKDAAEYLKWSDPHRYGLIK